MMEIDNKNIPKHIAVIMDGNGRWAKKKGENRLFGHQNGVKALKKLIEESARLNISYLTLFAFSTENWKRPKKEISTIMRLIVLVLKKELKTMMDNKIKLETIGDLEKLPENVKSNLIKTETLSLRVLRLDATGRCRRPIGTCFCRKKRFRSSSYRLSSAPRSSKTLRLLLRSLFMNKKRYGGFPYPISL